MSHIFCHPNGIYGYAEHDAVIVQEKETWFQLDISSPNLHECIRRCYGYRFCYSLTYDHTREKPCIFYLHASDKCPGKDLVNLNEIEYQNKPVSVACLKCGEPKNPQSQSSAKKTDDKPALEFSEDEHSESVPAEGETNPLRTCNIRR
uniref:Apple domain-containing protein n=1 Tax=Panagrolaimus davidi TaxID=227884 RepID=A0A914P0B3_9BILA